MALRIGRQAPRDILALVVCALAACHDGDRSTSSPDAAASDSAEAHVDVPDASDTSEAMSTASQPEVDANLEEGIDTLTGAARWAESSAGLRECKESKMF